MKATSLTKVIILLIATVMITACGNLTKSSTASKKHKKVVDVNPEYFIKDGLVAEITKEKRNLNGIETLCYVIKTSSQPSEHEMGPWCPRHASDGKEKGGIWFKDGKVYDVDGHFIASLADFYEDDRWAVLRANDSVKVTTTKEACLGAAKPNVEEQYKNHCVECLPEYFEHQITTFVIPVTPVYNQYPKRFRRGAIGIAFNGVNYDPPAPTHAILGAHTIAPLDDHGGHVNPHGGYHYHAATGSTKEIEQADNHAPILGYAIDGFGMYALVDKDEKKPNNLDECGGHYDEIRGYHYHAGEPGGNQIIKCLHGTQGFAKVQE